MRPRRRANSESVATVYPRIAGYEVRRLIEPVGGFSRVYEAVDMNLDRRVAIKVLNSGFETPQDERTFRNECQMMAALEEHPNVVRVHTTALTDDGRPAIVMKLFAGTCGQVDRMTPAEVVAVGIAIADALHAAHTNGIAHRDIKPDNVFLSSSGEPALGDFGISMRSGTTVGVAGRFTMEYVAPEFFTDVTASSPVSRDIYSLGATLYRLASGSIPYQGMDTDTDNRQRMQRLLNEPTPRLSSSVPAGLAGLVERCMAKNPNVRPPSAAAVRDELRSLQPQVGEADLSLLTRFLDSRSADPGPSAQGGRRQSDPGASPNGIPTVIRDDKMLERREVHRHPRAADGWSRWRPVLLGAAAVATIAIIGIVLTLIDGSDEGAPEDSAAGTPSTTEPADFEVLTAPTDLSVIRLDDDSFELTWEHTDATTSFQVELVGSTRTALADGTSYTWEFGEPAGAGGACFQVRTVDVEQSRMSASAAGPVCGP